MLVSLCTTLGEKTGNDILEVRFGIISKEQGKIKQQLHCFYWLSLTTKKMRKMKKVRWRHRMRERGIEADVVKERAVDGLIEFKRSCEWR